jgi:hypothetical protein
MGRKGEITMAVDYLTKGVAQKNTNGEITMAVNYLTKGVAQKNTNGKISWKLTGDAYAHEMQCLQTKIHTLEARLVDLKEERDFMLTHILKAVGALKGLPEPTRPKLQEPS